MRIMGKMLILMFLLAAALNMFSGCEMTQEEIAEQTGNIASGVINGMADAVGRVDGDKVTEAVGKVVSTVGGGLVKGIDEILDNMDKEKAAKNVSNVIDVIANGVTDGVGKAVKKLKDSDQYKDLTTEEKTSLLEQIENARDNIMANHDLTEDEKQEALTELQTVEDEINET